MSVDEVFNNIKNFSIIWPEIGYGEDMLYPEAKSLILKFLEKDPTKRLTNFDQIKRDPYFKNFDWVNLHKQKPSILTPFNTEQIGSNIRQTNFYDQFMQKNSL